MQFSHTYLKEIDGLGFYKLMGTGKGNGFNPWPDFSTYALVQVWESEKHAHHFFRSSEIMNMYENHSTERWTLLMRTIRANGLWSGQNPFEPSEDLDSKIPYLAVITRATIRTSKLLPFWRYVPTSEKPIERNAGLMYTKGVGEVPLLQMATFSLWENEESLKAFAYQSTEHAKAIKLTRELNWFSEELFSRFQPYESYGTWGGRNLLPDLAPRD